MSGRKPKKSKPLPKLVDEAATLLQLLVRLEAADDNGYCQCVTCGVIKHYKDGMQGGHFISRGKGSTKLMKENIHPQCDSCNGFGMKFHNCEARYTTWMIDYYGREFVDELLILSRQPKKHNRLEIEELITETKKLIKEHEDRICEL